MKRVLLFLLVLGFIGGSAYSADIMQYPMPLDGGNVLLDIGLGLALSSNPDMSIGIPPIVLSAEYCLPPIPLSVGGLIGLYQYKRSFAGAYDSHSWTWTYVTLGGRANWHFNFFDLNWLDLYAGLFAGYTSIRFSSTRGGDKNDYDNLNDGLNIGLQAGAHFYFTDRIGAVAELGYPFVVKAGLALKFN